MNTKFIWVRLFFLGLFTLWLGACGSGSSSSPAPAPSTPPPAPPPPSSPPPSSSPLPPIPKSPFATQEFQFSYALQAINPIPAYEAGGTGKGVVVAVIDSGFEPDHSDINSVFHPASIDLINGPGRGSLDGDDIHGGQVAAVIAAEKNNRGIHGVAFDVQILAIRIDALNTCANDDCTFFVSDITDAIFYALANGADIINISLGGDGVTQGLLSAFAAARDAGVLIVTSAGNEGEDNPNAFSKTPGLSQFLGSGLIVGAVDANLNLASFSNRAGSSRQAFLVAPGVRVGTINVNDFFTRASGTSFSAPFVAGAAAILLSLFPNLDAQDLFDILTQTATDLGARGVDGVFGKGLINIGAALQPLGATSFVTASSESDSTTDVPTDDSGSGFSIAFGDAFFNIEELSSVMMLDGFRRSYMVDAGAFMTHLFNSSFSLIDAIDRGRSVRSLFLPISRSEGFTLALADPNYRERPFQELLPRGIQDQMKSRTPYLFFDTDVTDKLAVGLSFGFSPGLVMDRMDRRGGLSRDFLAARFGGTPHLSFMEDTKGLTLYRSFSPKTTAMVGTSIGNYDFSRQLPFTGNLPRASAMASYLRVNHREGRFEVSITAGFLKEDNAILGSISTGALSLGSGALSQFVGFRADINLGRGFAFTGQYTSGWTEIENAAETFITDTSRFRTSSFSAALSKRGVFKSNDRLGVALYQPLRVENGAVSLTLPTGRDYEIDRILFTDSSAALEPSSRQFDVEVSYRIYGRKGFVLEANYIHQFNPGHSFRLNHADAFLVRLGKNF